MNQKEFIEVVILNQIGDVVKLHPYLSFPLIATAIELLGSCIDKSKIQLLKAINHRTPAHRCIKIILVM